MLNISIPRSPTAFVASIFFVATWIFSLPVSADWEGTILTEKPSGQAEDAGWASPPPDNEVIVPVELGFLTALDFSGHGTVRIVTRQGGTVIQEETGAGAINVNIYTNDAGIGSIFHSIQVFAGPPVGGAPQIVKELNAPDGYSVLIDLKGSFDVFYTPNGGFVGPQDGQLLLEMSVNTAP